MYFFTKPTHLYLLDENALVHFHLQPLGFSTYEG
jgi:hypothetical protein